MLRENYNVIGVMSGTSLDGIDLAHIQFQLRSGKWSFTIAECETVAYDPEWVVRLNEAVRYTDAQRDALDSEYSVLLAAVITAFIHKYQIGNIDAVCSHGHTVLHQPQNGITVQIGNRSAIAQLCGQTVVCDFRVQDVALGGQGAPLVPIGDRILFSGYDYCLNLGGFSNVSFEQDGQRIAFDISAVNTVLNFYAKKLGFAFDRGGAISRTGNIHAELLAELNALEYYKKPYPKSLGIEYVNTVMLPLIQRYALPPADCLGTFTEHIAQQLAAALRVQTGSMLVTGGGAYNTFLMERIQHYLPLMQIVVPEPKILEFKEALIFALLGVLRLRNETNVLHSVTGASHDHCSGVVFVPE